MEIVKVCLHNFRSHEFFEFCPKSGGVTVLQGSNGSGKSSIVDSIAWCLYNICPVGVKKRSQLIKHGVTVNKNTHVGVSLTIKDNNNNIYEIDRRIVNKAGACECSVYKIVGDSRELLSGPAVSYSDVFLRKLIGVDSKSFLTSAFVQQKQVDNIITATAKERSLVFEKMTGVTALTESGKTLKEDLKTVKNSLQLFSFDSVSHNQNVKEFETIKSVLADLKNKGVKQEKKCKTLTGMVVENKNKLSEMRDSLGKVLQAQSVVDSLFIEEDEAKLKEIKKQVDVLKTKMGDSLGVDFETVRLEYEKLQEKHVGLKNEKNNVLNQIKEYETFIENNTISESKEALLSSLEQTQTSIEEYEKTLSSCKNEYSKRLARIEILKTQTLNLDVDSKCPTCLQTVSDGFVQKHNSEISNKILVEENKTKDLDNTISDMNNSIVDCKRELDRINDSLVLFDKIEDYKNKITCLQETLDNISVEHKKTGALLVSKKKSFNKSVELFETKTLLGEKMTQIEEINNIISTKIKKIGEARKVLETNKHVSKEKVDSLAKKLEAQNSELLEAKSLLSTIMATYSEKKNSRNVLEKLVKQGEENKLKYDSLFAQQDRIMKALKDVDEFRQNIVDKSIPMIEFMASDLVSKFTDGTVSNIRLDSKFVVTVENKGMVFPVEMLSGGEQSCVAIALRLAIAYSVANLGFIVLDEVFVSMDNVRAENIINTIVKYFDGQVIFISHTSNIGVVADKTVVL